MKQTNYRVELSDLLDMLAYRRPMGGETEDKFIEKYIEPIPGMTVDAHGNYHCDLGGRTLYSCHTDTVHHCEGLQRVRISGSGRINLHRRERTSNCLGADDTVGIWIMLSMIAAQRPGYYLFHFGEECGAIGSRALAKIESTWIRDRFDHAIAFDRRDTSDVITHQGCQRTCSDVFGRALADQLNTIDDRFSYTLSKHGIFTDTESYADLIPECTNVSVGYHSAHSNREWIDGRHALRLRNAMLTFDPTSLPVDRDPTVIDIRSAYRVDWMDVDIDYTLDDNDHDDRNRDNAPLDDPYPDIDTAKETFGYCLACGDTTWLYDQYCESCLHVQDMMYLDREWDSVQRAFRAQYNRLKD